MAYRNLLLTGDFGTSRVFLNQGDGTFLEQALAVVGEENGKGSAVGDYDNDGDLDWFVSGIFDPGGVLAGDPTVAASGNRLYRNNGDGTFVDVTDAAGVRDGGWGQATAFGDLNLDGSLDLYLVNGMGGLPDGTSGENFSEDAARLFIGDPAGTFTEQASLLGVADTGMGRGMVLVDFDRDGDLDILNQNVTQTTKLYRNDLETAEHFLVIKLIGRAANREAIGTRIYLTAGGVTQMRELRRGNNFVSANAVEAHFGLGSAALAEELRIIWPDGGESTFENIVAGQHLQLRQPDSPPENCQSPGGSNHCSLGGKYRSPVECLMEMKISPTPKTDRRGMPGYRIYCHAGDASCDAHPEDKTSCSLDVSLCLSNSDPRNFVCEPGEVNRIRIRTPRAGVAKEADVLMRTFAVDLVGEGLASLAIPEGSPFTTLRKGLCIAAERLTIPLRESATGNSYRKNSARLKIQAFAKDGRRDQDQLILRCYPPKNQGL